jgi:hypothetical protein
VRLERSWPNGHLVGDLVHTRKEGLLGKEQPEAVCLTQSLRHESNGLLVGTVLRAGDTQGSSALEFLNEVLRRMTVDFHSGSLVVRRGARIFSSLCLRIRVACRRKHGDRRARQKTDYRDDEYGDGIAAGVPGPANRNEQQHRPDPDERAYRHACDCRAVQAPGRARWRGDPVGRFEMLRAQGDDLVGSVVDRRFGGQRLRPSIQVRRVRVAVPVPPFGISS